MKKLYISALLDVYGEFLSEKQRIVTDHYFNDDLSLAEIAENEGIPRQGVYALIKRAEAQLAEMEEKCHYCEYFWSLKSLGEDFRQGKENAIDEILEIIEKL